MATGDKVVTLDGLKAVYDSQDTNGIKQDISDLKSALDEQYINEGTKEYSAAGNNWFAFSFKAGHVYTVTNMGTTNITAMQTVPSNGSYSYIENIISSNLNAGANVTFIPTVDAPYVHTYNAGAGTYTIVEKTSVRNIYDTLNDVSAVANGAVEKTANLAIAVGGNAKKLSLNPVWERNGINTSNGADWSNINSIRTKYIHFDTDATVIGTALNSVNSCTAFIYTSTKAFKSSSSIQTNTSIKLEVGEYLRIHIYGSYDYPTDINSPETYLTLSVLNELNTELPDYYKTYLDGKIDSIITASAYLRGVTFPFITDVHLQANALNSGKLIRDIDKRTNAVPFVVFGGDVPKAVDTSANVLAYANQWNEYMDTWGKHKTVQVHGNHDYMCALDDSLSNLWFAPLSKCFEYIQQNNYFMVKHPAGSLYGCIDIHNQNIKVIYADNFDGSYDIENDTWNGSVGMSNEQLKWIATEVLSNSVGYHVLFVSHVPTLSSIGNASEATALKPFDDLIKAARNKTSYTVDGETFNFANWDGTVIGELCGHTHKDASGTSDGVVYINTTCDTYLDSDSQVTRTVGTTSEQAFDVVCIDANSRTIKLVRIGVGSDREFTY